MICTIDSSVLEFLNSIEKNRSLDEKTLNQWNNMTYQQRDSIREWIIDNWQYIGFPISLKVKGYKSICFENEPNRAGVFLVRAALKDSPAHMNA